MKNLINDDFLKTYHKQPHLPNPSERQAQRTFYHDKYMSKLENYFSTKDARNLDIKKLRASSGPKIARSPQASQRLFNLK